MTIQQERYGDSFVHGATELSATSKIAQNELKPWRNTSETRITDPVTGGAKCSKIARFDLIPPDALWALAEHYGKGAEKYADRNYEKGYKWGLSVASLQRHLHQWLMGESVDPETGTNHLIAVAWHAFALFIFERRGLGTDDVRLKGASQSSTPQPLPVASQIKSLLGTTTYTGL